MAFLTRLLAALRALGRGHGYLDVSTGRWLPPIAGADGADDDGSGGEGDGGDDKESAGAGADDGGDGDGDSDSDEDRVRPDDDWKTIARKHERAAKRRQKRIEELEQKLREHEDKNKSEIEKQLEKARQEAREEALREAEQERRRDRLEVAITRAASKGIKVGDKTMRFADPEDAQVHIERMISRGDLDADELFDDDGKVVADELASALRELAEQKPHLLAGDGDRLVSGKSDAGRGSGRRGDDIPTVDEIIERKRKRK